MWALHSQSGASISVSISVYSTVRHHWELYIFWLHFLGGVILCHAFLFNSSFRALALCCPFLFRPILPDRCRLCAAVAWIELWISALIGSVISLFTSLLLSAINRYTRLKRCNQSLKGLKFIWFDRICTHASTSRLDGSCTHAHTPVFSPRLPAVQWVTCVFCLLSLCQQNILLVQRQMSVNDDALDNFRKVLKGYIDATSAHSDNLQWVFAWIMTKKYV